MDIGGAFLYADITTDSVKVRMRLDKLMTAIQVKIDPTLTEFLLSDGTSVIELGRALCGH